MCVVQFSTCRLRVLYLHFYCPLDTPGMRAKWTCLVMCSSRGGCLGRIGLCKNVCYCKGVSKLYVFLLSVNQYAVHRPMVCRLAMYLT